MTRTPASSDPSTCSTGVKASCALAISSARRGSIGPPCRWVAARIWKPLPPPRGGRWTREARPYEGGRAERDGSGRATRGAIASRSVALSYISQVSGARRSHLAPLDLPHPSLLRNDTFPRKGGRDRAQLI